MGSCTQIWSKMQILEGYAEFEFLPILRGESTSLLSSVASLVLNVGNGLQLCRSVAKAQEPVAGPLSPRFFL